MLNLIKKDIVKIIKHETNNILKYIIIFLVLYLGFNNLFYSGISIFISYLIVSNIFNYQDKDIHKGYIKNAFYEKKDIVYTRYIITTFIIIITNLIIILIMKLLSSLMFRGIVFNDVLFSINVYLTIMSVVLPLFFQYGYHNVRFLCGVVGIIVYCVFGSFINMFNDRIYEVEYFNYYRERIVLNYYSGSFSKIISEIVYGIDTKYLSMFFMTAITITLFVFSMYISIRIVKIK